MIIQSPKGFPRGSDGKESACNAGDPGSITGLLRFPWRKKWQPTPEFFPGESHGQRSLAGYSPWGRKALDMTEQLAHCAALRRAPVLRELMVLGEEWGLKTIQGITIQCA